MTIQLTVTYEGATGAVTIQWFKDGVLVTDGTFSGVTVSGATTATLLIENATSDWNGEYFATVTDSIECSDSSDPITINVDCTIHILDQPTAVDGVFGECAEFSVTAGGGVGPILYQWYKDGVAVSDGTTPAGSTITGATTDTMEICNLQTEDAGNYTVIITDDGTVDCSVETTPVALTIDIIYGPGVVPAYSEDSTRVIATFAQYPGLTGGPIMSRRVPPASRTGAVNVTGLNLTGGAAWCPLNNKFYHGASQTGVSDGLVAIIDPVTSAVTYINIGGADGQSAGRAFYFASIQEIWLAAPGGGNMFIRIDPSNDTFIGYVAGALIIDFDYCSSNDCLYAISGGTLYKIDSSGTVTPILVASAIDPVVLPNAAFGVIAYASSVDRVVFTVYQFSPSGYFFAWAVDPSDDSTGVYAASVGGSHLYYSEEYDRFILQATNNGGPSGLPTVLGSFTTAFVFVKTLDYGSTGSSDDMTAKGCFCPNINKEAIPVLQGPGGGRFYDLGFYGAAELT